MVQLLVETGGAYSNQHRSNAGWSPMELSVLIDSDEGMIAYLAAHTLDCHPLHESIAQRSPTRIIARLMEILPSDQLYARDSNGMTAVEVAVDMGNEYGLRTLIESGMRADQRNSRSGYTLLQRSVARSVNSTIRMLLKTDVVAYSPTSPWCTASET